MGKIVADEFAKIDANAVAQRAKNNVSIKTRGRDSYG